MLSEDLPNLEDDPYQLVSSPAQRAGLLTSLTSNIINRSSAFEYKQTDTSSFGDIVFCPFS